MDHILLAIAITEGIGFIAAMLRFSYQAGKVIERLENHDRRIGLLEEEAREAIE